MKGKATYFESMGKAYTDETLRIAKERALEAGMKTVIVSSSRGYTAEKALKVFKGTDVRVIVVGIQKEFPPRAGIRAGDGGAQSALPEPVRVQPPSRGVGAATQIL